VGTHGKDAMSSIHPLKRASPIGSHHPSLLSEREREERRRVRTGFRFSAFTKERHACLYTCGPARCSPLPVSLSIQHFCVARLPLSAQVRPNLRKRKAASWCYLAAGRRRCLFAIFSIETPSITKQCFLLSAQMVNNSSKNNHLSILQIYI